MYCSKCGSVMDEGDAFCTKCGFSPITQNSAYLPASQSTTPLAQGYIHTKNNVWQRVKQGENEKLVKTFTCNRLKSFLLGIDSDGFLSVTNKRILYWSENRKPTERNIIQSEMPLNDVSGMNFYKGRIFSWHHFILMYLLNLLVSIMATFILAAIGSASPLAAMVLTLAAAFGSLVGASVHFAVKRQWNHPVIPLLVNISSAGFVSAGGASLLSGLLSSPLAMMGMSSSRMMLGATIAWIIFWILTSLAYLFTLIMYARRPTFTVTLLSKSGSGTSIKITGVRKISCMETITSKAMSNEPGEDSESMAYQLGAMISELQENGEEAYDKWSK